VPKSIEISLVPQGSAKPDTIDKPYASTSFSFALQNVSNDVLHNSLSNSTEPVLELVGQHDQEHIKHIDVSVPNDQTQTHGMNSPSNHCA
jgi:hypothetical protein